MATQAERQKAYRERKKAALGQRLSLWLTADAYTSLELLARSKSLSVPDMATDIVRRHVGAVQVIEPPIGQERVSPWVAKQKAEREAAERMTEGADF